MEEDIDDPFIHVDLENLADYSKVHLIGWLKYRGDTLKHLDSMKEIRNRVLQYINNCQQNEIVDPTGDLKWKKRKAFRMGIEMRVILNESMPECPNVLKNDLGEIKSIAGWSKSLMGLPTFNTSNIKKYYEHINKVIAKKSSIVKKHFERGSQLLEESFISVESIYAKDTENLYCLKGICAASLKKKDRWVTIAISKNTANIEFAYCQCTAGKTGTCSHAFALMKLVAKWVLDNKSEVPDEVACTSKLCYWSVPQSRDRTRKVPIPEITFKSPESHQKRKMDESENADDQNLDINPPAKKKNRAKGIVSTLYDPRPYGTKDIDQNGLSSFIQNLKNDNASMALNVINEGLSATSIISTPFGKVPIGSVLGSQCPTIPSDFAVHCNIDTSQDTESTVHIFPEFPLVLEVDSISKHLEKLSDSKREFVEKLKITPENVDEIEKKTIEQANNPEWFIYRRNRFTASRNNQLRSKNPKTDRGFITLAKSFISPPTFSRIVKFKMGFGRFYEPIAITRYEQYLKSCNYHVQVEKSGLVIDPVNYVLGASPDGKIVDTSEVCKFGILEVKCSEEYKDFDPKSVAFISKTSCIELIDHKLRLKKSHSYYDQIQMQLALTTKSWCDFVFFTLKGMVIDRVHFDQEHWINLKEKILTFYFKYLLDACIENENTSESTASC